MSSIDVALSFFERNKGEFQFSHDFLNTSAKPFALVALGMPKKMVKNKSEQSLN